MTFLYILGNAESIPGLTDMHMPHGHMGTPCAIILFKVQTINAKLLTYSKDVTKSKQSAMPLAIYIYISPKVYNMKQNYRFRFEN